MGFSITEQSRPSEILDALRTFASDLAASPDVSVAMIAAYGSLVRGNYRPGHSDTNLICVLDRADQPVLERLRPLMAEGRRTLRLAPFVLTRTELGQAVDSFAGKLADVRDAYQLLVGEDLLEPLAIDFANLRLACEREVRNAALRLRRAYLLGQVRPALPRVALEQLLPSLLGALRVLVAVARPGLPRSGEPLVDALAHALAFDPEPLKDAYRQITRSAAATDEGFDCARLLPVMDAIVSAVDGYRP